MEKRRVRVYDSLKNLKGEYISIQGAINAASDGDDIVVDPGTYNEAIYIDKEISLYGGFYEKPKPVITSEGLDMKSTVTFKGTNNAKIQGFIIQGAKGGLIYGNGIFCSQGSAFIVDNILSENEYCGVLCEDSSPIILNNRILDNAVGVLGYHSREHIANNIILGNRYGIECFTDVYGSIINNTIIANAWDGIHIFNSSPVIMNNIIMRNGGTELFWHGICAIASSPIIDYNCLWQNGTSGKDYEGCSSGLHDISADPQFVGDDDFHLKPTSPCIDAGSNEAVIEPLTIEIDFDGNSRIADGNHDGVATVDMGAYEYQGKY